MSSSRKTAGSEHWYSHALVGISYSPAGRNASRRAGGANWLLDEIALQPHDKRVAAEEFQMWRSKYMPTQRHAHLRRGQHRLQQAVELTDFPLAGVGTLACIAPRDLIQLAPPRSWFCVADSHTRGRSIAAIRR